MSKKKLKLLVVDDQPGYCSLIQEQVDLCSHQFDIDLEFTSNEAGASALLESWHPSVILVDAHLSANNCFELLRRWKGGLTSLMVTSDQRSKEIELQALEGGAIAYITKTEDPEDLQLLLERIVNLVPELPQLH